MQLKEIIAALAPDKIAQATSHVMRLEQLMKLQNQRDTEIVQSIIRVLQHPAHQRLANELRNLILKGTNQ